MANSRARARIEARVRERVAYCLEFEVSDPRAGFITITGVEVSPDLSQARVRYSVYGTPADRGKVAHMLEDATGFIRSRVGRVLKTRTIPRLIWHYDDSIEYQANMEKLISGALERDRSINPTAHLEGPPVESPTPPKDEGEVDEGDWSDLPEDWDAPADGAADESGDEREA